MTIPVKLNNFKISRRLPQSHDPELRMNRRAELQFACHIPFRG